MKSLIQTPISGTKTGDCDFLYIGQESSYHSNEIIKDYDAEILESEINSFLADYRKADEIILFCGISISADNTYVRLQKQFDYRQMSLQRLFELLKLDKQTLDYVFEIKKTVKSAGLFKKRIFKTSLIFDKYRKQFLSDLLKKRIIIYDSPKEDFLCYSPERYTPKSI